MNGAFHISGVGLDSQQKALDVIAHNIANMNTQGFKRSDVSFSEILSAQAAEDAALSANLTAETVPGGTRPDVRVMMDMQGELQSTGNAMDVAISGSGFLEVMGSNGQGLLWRGGALGISEEGFLTAGNGMMLKSMVSVPLEAQALEIRRDGTVVAQMPGEDGDVEIEEVGQLMLVRVADATSLERLDGGLYRMGEETQIIDAVAGEDGAGDIMQGMIERSNVDLNTEMVGMMVVQRAYSANAQVLRAADEMVSIANNLRR